MTGSELFEQILNEFRKDIKTSVPGYIIAFDKVTQLAQVQIGIVKTKKDGTTENPAPLIEVPVSFPGGDYFLEHEITDGKTEGMIFFSQRCIDAWNQTGGVAENPIMRFHDENDAYFIPGLRSQVNKIKDFQNNGVRLRNKNGTKYMWLKNDGTGEFKLNGLNIISDVTVDGDVSSSGTVTGDTDVVGGGISVSTHTHGYTDTPVGKSETLPPTASE